MISIDELYSGTVLAEPVPSLSDVRGSVLGRYGEEGYIAVEDAFSSAQIDAALEGLAALTMNPRTADIQYEKWVADRLEEFDGPARMDCTRRLMQFVDLEPALKAIAYDEQLLRVARKIIGEDDIVLFQDMALMKPPGGGREKPWHQDNAFFTIKPGTPIVGIWIALDKATVANGCMHVIPGSHREGPVIHFKRRDFQICDTDVQTWRDVAVPLDPGGLLIFDGLLHHGTPPNTTDTRRRALQFHYIARSAQMVSQGERLAAFGSEGKDASC
ncbi:phytanoyl-CoA dioxygenase family protein [Pseudactinotalea sp. Z1739]|uniref:phytanoyl-CoA dioxygenase family protein n=1 Tax=Pseudactinotalea sp. Z1739 TaxID=3413028 RepID=UPI003C7EB85D